MSDKTLAERIEALPDGCILEATPYKRVGDKFVEFKHVDFETDELKAGFQALLTRAVEADAKVAAEKEFAREQFAYGIFFGRFQGNERIENLTGGDVTALFESVWDAIYAPKGDANE